MPASTDPVRLTARRMDPRIIATAGARIAELRTQLDAELDKIVDEVERADEEARNITRAAKIAGVSRSTIHARINKRNARQEA